MTDKKETTPEQRVLSVVEGALKQACDDGLVDYFNVSIGFKRARVDLWYSVYGLTKAGKARKRAKR